MLDARFRLALQAARLGGRGRMIVLAGLAAPGLAGCAAHHGSAVPGPAAMAGVPAAQAAGPEALPRSRRPALGVAELASLDALTGRDLVARLGEPDFTRRDPPAEIWQYRSDSCVLDLFLYPDGSDLKVAYIASRSRETLEAPGNQCSPFGKQVASTD